MKILILTITILLTSCSAKWHLNRAIAKGVTFEKDSVSVTVVKREPETAKVNGKDTIIYTTTEITRDSVFTNTFVPKTRQEIRQEAKVQKVKLKEESKVKRDSLKVVEKVEKVKIKKGSPKTTLSTKQKAFTLLIFIIGIILVFIRVKRLFRI